jgi:hypothetical protein
MRLAETDEAGTLGVAGDRALETDGAQGIGRAFGRTHVDSAEVA